MLKKGTKLYSVIHNKCPRCQEGDFFKYKNPYNLRKFDKMDKRCSVCSENYEPEPGFYYGAMYVSYSLNIAIMVTLWIALEVLDIQSISNVVYMASIIIPSVLLTPLTFRIARLIWINICVNYKKEDTSQLNQLNFQSKILTK